MKRWIERKLIALIDKFIFSHSVKLLNYIVCFFQGIKKLLPGKEVDRKKELRKLNHSILLNFLDLIEILIKVYLIFIMVVIKLRLGYMHAMLISYILYYFKLEKFFKVNE